MESSGITQRYLRRRGLLVLGLLVAATCVSLVTLAKTNLYEAKKSFTIQIIDNNLIALSELSRTFEALSHAGSQQKRSALRSQVRREKRHAVAARQGLVDLRQTGGLAPETAKVLANPSLDPIGALDELLVISEAILDPRLPKLREERMSAMGADLSNRLLGVMFRLQTTETAAQKLAQGRLSRLNAIAATISVLGIFVAVFFVQLPMEHLILTAHTQLELARNTAEAAQQRFNRLADNFPGALVERRVSADGRLSFPYFSAKLPEIVGVPRAVIEENADAVLRNFDPADRKIIFERSATSARQLSAFEERFRIMHPEKGPRWIMISSLPFRRTDGSVAWYGSVIDITERIEIETRVAEVAAKLKRSHDRLTLLTDVAPVGLYEFRSFGDGKFAFPYVSGQFSEFFGVDAIRIQKDPTSLLKMIDPADLPRLTASVRESARSETEWRSRFRVKHPERGVLWMSGTAVPRWEPDGVVWTGALLDVTPDVHREDELRHAHRLAERMRSENENQALHDGLTGLPNRRYYDRIFAERLVDARGGTATDCTLLRLDLDHFKHVNDTLGHAAGDNVLVRVGRILRHSIRDSDFAARIGGDEFSILFAPGISEQETCEMVSRIRGELAQPVLYEGRQCRFGASFGIARVDDLREVGPDIQMFADAALYRAKEAGRNRIELFTPELHDTLLRDRRLSVEIHEALDRDQFVPFFQPQICSADGRLVGAEVLLRWQHPSRGLLAPGAFMHVIEQMHMVPEIDRIMMEKTQDAMARWRDRGVFVPKVSFNVSAGRVHDPGIVEFAKRLNMGETRITFELLESILVEEENDIFREHLDRIREVGIDIEIDDFGSGHASIISLLEIKPSALKIDKRIVLPVADDPRARDLVSAIVEIAGTLGVRTVAEGVETDAQARILRDIGCNILQGFLFAQPLNETDFQMFALTKEPKRGICA